MKIADLPEFNNTQENITLSSNNKVIEAVKEMVKHHIGAIPIIDNDKLVGIFTERDLSTRVLNKNLDIKKTTLAEVMTKKIETITENVTLAESIEKMRKGHYRHSLVVDKSGKLLQILSQRVFVANNWFLSLLEKHKKHINSSTILADVIKSNGNDYIISISSDKLASEAINLITTKRIGAIPIIDNNNLVGIFTERDVMIKIVYAGLDPNKTVLHDVMTKKLTTLTVTAKINDCLEAMALGKFRHILIVNDSGELIKILSLRDFMTLK